MTKQWHFYTTSPIDCRWKELMTVEDTISSMIHRYKIGDCERCSPDECVCGFGTDITEILNFIRTWDSVKYASLHAGWEGDFSVEPRVLWLPNPDDFIFEYAFAWKQSNNGTCFVASPIPLALCDEGVIHSFIQI